ncbi:DNA polymerase III subunit delta [bacterium]|nr:DNA polymerase III subunit delta [bacterium]
MKLWFNGIPEVIKLKQPVIFLDGDEYYFKEEIVKLLKKQILGKEGSVFNFQEVNPDNWENRQSFESNLRQLGFLGKRFVLINYFDSFSTQNQKDILSTLINLNVKDNNSLEVLIVTGKKLQVNQKKELLKIFNDFIKEPNIAYMNIYNLNTYDLKNWINKYFKDKGKSIQLSYIDYVIASTDNSLIAIKKELDKIILYMGDKKFIELSDINEATGDFKIVNFFDFSDAVFFSSKNDALMILDRIIDESSTGWDMRLLQTLWWTFKRNLNISKAIKTSDDKTLMYKIMAPKDKKPKILSNIKVMTFRQFKVQSMGLMKLELTLKGRASNIVLKRKAYEDFIFQMPLITH